MKRVKLIKNLTNCTAGSIIEVFTSEEIREIGGYFSVTSDCDLYTRAYNYYEDHKRFTKVDKRDFEELEEEKPILTGLDLYKDAVLDGNGEKYLGKQFSIKGTETKIVVEEDIHLKGKYELIISEGNIAKPLFDSTTWKIDSIMKAELEEIKQKQKIEMPWDECIKKYIKNPEKYWIRTVDTLSHIIYSHGQASTKGKLSLIKFSAEEIANYKWFLCEK